MPSRAGRRLTNLMVERLRPAAERVEISDAGIPALRLVVQPSGAKSWALRARAPDGRTMKLTLGGADAHGVAEARDWASATLKKIKAGVDPREEAAEDARAAERERRSTLGALVDGYLAHHANDHLATRTRVEVERALRRCWEPLHGVPLAKLARAQIASQLLVLKAERGGTTANRCRAYLSAALSWGVRAGLLEANPGQGVAKPAPERVRDRVLSLDELREVWAACDRPLPYSRIIRLCLVLGCRREEAGGMRWAELSGDHATWTLPGERTKNGRARELALPPAAVDVIAGVPKVEGRDTLFGRAGFSAWSQEKRSLDRRIATRRAEAAARGDLAEHLVEGARKRAKAAGLTAPAVDDFAMDWSPHDLRRSWSTHAQDELGIAPHVVDEVLGHAGAHREGARAAYNRAHYREPKRVALAAYAAWVVESATATVVTLRAS